MDERADQELEQNLGALELVRIALLASPRTSEAMPLSRAACLPMRSESSTAAASLHRASPSSLRPMASTAPWSAALR